MILGHSSIAGKMKSKKIDANSGLTVGGSFGVKGNTRARDIDVGGKFARGNAKNSAFTFILRISP